MPRRFKKLSLLCLPLFCAACLLNAQGSSALKMTPGLVTNFELPSFDKESGYKEWEVFGKNASYVSDSQIIVNDMRLVMFDGKESLKQTAVFLSKTADFSPTDTSAKSDDTLFVEGEGFNLKGDDWHWSGAKRFVELLRDVSVDFSAEHEGKSEKLHVKSARASMDYSGASDKFLFKGDVSVQGEDFKINSGELQTESPKNENRNIETLKEIIVKKNVVIVQEKISATAEFARLIPSSGDLALEGLPIVVDAASKASVSGYRIDFIKAESKAVAHSSENKKIRAKALIISQSDDGEHTTVISADTIEMLSLDGKNIFNFKGNVHVKAEDFEAFGDVISAEAKKGGIDQKYAISKISGKGNIKFIREGRVASGREIEIYPNTGEVRLIKDAMLDDKSQGMNLKADKIILYRNEDRALAQSDENSFVTLDIMQSENFGLDTKKSARKTRIKSRTLEMTRKNKDVFLSFKGDVSIATEDINAVCQKMDVFAESESIKGRTVIKKIEASADVVIRQKGVEAQAQLAKIFPRVDVEISKTQKTSHRYMQLLTDPQMPQKRPRMILPSIDNIGLGTVRQNVARENTVIVSDKQSFVSEPDKDTYFFEGNVIITGTDFTAECGKVEVEMKSDKNGNRKIALIILTENVSVVQGNRSAAAGRADIYPDQEMIVLSDSPLVINEDKTHVRGSRIIYTKGKSSVSVENPIINLPPVSGKK